MTTIKTDYGPVKGYKLPKKPVKKAAKPVKPVRRTIPSDIGLRNSPAVQKKYNVGAYGKKK